jgi:phospholipid transport system substrate-binding protein
VEVNSQVISSRGGEPIQLSYRLEKKADGWKLYDINVLGAWLVEAYAAPSPTRSTRAASTA